MRALDELREVLIGTVELEYGHEPLCDFIDDIFDDFIHDHDLYDLTNYHVKMGVSEAGIIVITATPKK